MRKLWTKSLPSVYNTWFHGALLQENNYLKYYFFYPSNISPISDITFDINSGEIIFDFNTKGTCNFLQVNRNIYFAMSKKKRTIIHRIDYDGNILDSLELEGTRDDYDPLALWDESIYIVTQSPKRDVDRETYYPIVHRIALS